MIVKKNKSQFNKLSSNIGKKILLEYITNSETKLIEGTLLNVNPFENIKIEAEYLGFKRGIYSRLEIRKNNKELQFIEKEVSIKTILGEEGEILYHNQNLISQPKTQEEIQWIKYLSGFSDENLEKKALDTHNIEVEEIREFENKRQYIKMEGGKLIKPELRTHWNQLCNNKGLISYVLEPTLKVMRALGKGFHIELSNISKEYGLSGYQFNTMINAINYFSPTLHPESIRSGKWLQGLKSA